MVVSIATIIRTTSSSSSITTFYVHQTQVHRLMSKPDYPVKDECCSRAVVVCFYSIECEEALGMGDGEISNGQVIASSQLDAEHAAINGRLKAIRTSNKVGSWSPYTNNVKQWLQIDLGSQKRTLVAKIATQGDNANSMWVTHYTLQYGDNGDKFNVYKELGQGKDKVRRLFFAKVKKSSLAFLQQPLNTYIFCSCALLFRVKICLATRFL